MAKRFNTPFAQNGDKTDVPNSAQIDGTVSYEQGYPVGYELDYTNHLAKDINRNKMNALMHDITDAIREIQQNGVAEWSEDGKPYKLKALVYDETTKSIKQSLVANNTANLSDKTKWAEIVNTANLDSLLTGYVKNTGNQTIADTKTFSSNIVGNLTGNVSGNSGSATKLQTARTIGGIPFDGTQNINLPGVDIPGSQNTTGNAGSATKLQTARTINGVSFDGTANINIGADNITTGTLAVDRLPTIPNTKISGLGTASTLNAGNGSGPLVRKEIGGYYHGTIQQLHLDAEGAPDFYAGNSNISALSFVGESAIVNIIKPTIWNNRDVALQCAHPDQRNVSTGTIHLNPVGGDVQVNKRQVIHSGNLQATTGQSTEYPMTQKAVTDGLDTKLNSNANAVSATKLATARTINGVSFDGSANITVADSTSVKLTGNETIAGTKTFSSVIAGSINGNSATATKLATARTINGVSFDGTANITTANWGTARDITIGNTTKSVNGSANVAFSLAEIGAGVIAGSNTQNGYVKLSNGLIMQWATVTESTSGSNYATFPIAFPTACFSVVLQLNASTTGGLGVNVGTAVQVIDRTKFIWTAGGTYAGGGVAYMIAIGH